MLSSWLSRIVYVVAFFAVSIRCEDEGIVIQPEDGSKESIPKGTTISGGKNSGTISMGTPDLSDEDSQSDHMPTYLMCDACRILSMHFFNKLDKEINKYKSGPRELGEDTILDVTEGVCEDKFESHGIKEVDGVKRLAGPGFETAEIPGIMQGGGKWPFRFQKVCHQLLGDFGEENIYRVVKKKGKEGLESYLCYGRRGPCTTDKKKKKNNKKKFENEL